MSWLGVWTRAVIGPAVRRAMAVWLGAAIVGGVVFGPTAMHPRDLTQLALHVPAVGAVLAVTWILLFVPTARVLVRAEGASYLRSLPVSRWEPTALAVSAMIVLQLPWLALWVLGEGAGGFAIVVGISGVIALIALWRPRPARAGWPSWRRDRAALRGVYLRALRRRAADALVRGIGLAVLAGLAAGLMIRNNALVGRDAAVLGTGAIMIVLLPGWVGALFPLVEAHRASAWLAGSLGISAAARIAVLATIVAGVYAIGALIAVAAVAIAFGGIETIAWLAAVALSVASASSLIATRASVWADRSSSDRSASSLEQPEADAPKDVTSRGPAASRIVVGAIVASATAVICLGWLGITGVVAIAALGVFAVLTAKHD